MKIYPLGLIIFAGMLAAEAGRSAPPAEILAGRTPIPALEASLTRLPLDLKALVEDGCDNQRPTGKMGTCRITVIPASVSAPDPRVAPASHVDGTILDSVPVSPVPTKILWSPRDPDLEDAKSAATSISGIGFAVAQSVPSSCGSWTATLVLDPNVPQPASEILLDPAPDDSSRGRYSGILAMNVRLVLANGATKQGIDLPLKIGFLVTGFWNLTATAPSASESNLVFSADPKEVEAGCHPLWILNGTEACNPLLVPSLDRCTACDRNDFP